jgi:hypothetical protein
MQLSAGGYLAKPIFIIADKNMQKGLIDIYEVKGLGLQTGVKMLDFSSSDKREYITALMCCSQE